MRGRCREVKSEVVRPERGEEGRTLAVLRAGLVFPSPNVLTLYYLFQQQSSCVAIVSEAFKTCTHVSGTHTVFCSLTHWSLCATSLGSKGQGWHPSFIPHTHTPQKQKICQSDFHTEDHLSSNPIRSKTNTRTYIHLFPVERNWFILKVQEHLYVWFSPPWWSSGAVGNHPQLNPVYKINNMGSHSLDWRKK